METTIANWQYVDRLTGLYEEMGVSINREPYGPLTGTLVPPLHFHAVAIIEALLAAEQGVKNITVGYGQCGNLIQDIAAVRTLEELTEEYLAKYGYHDVVVTTVLHQWMGGFPADEAKAFGVISTGALIAALSKATKVIVKSPHEAIGIPTMEANAQGLRCTRQVVSMMTEQTFANTHLDEEMEIIRQETRCIVDKCFELGMGDIALGACRGVKAGVLDVPFAPCRFNAGQMLPCRDNDGAVRIMNMGNLPFTKELLDYHMGKIAERAAFEHRKATFQMVTDDVYAISKGTPGRAAQIKKQEEQNMKIKDVVCAAGSTGFILMTSAPSSAARVTTVCFTSASPSREGFSAVRMKGEAVSVMIVLEDGQIAFGDCAAVQYSGAGGRDPLFLAKDFIPIIEQYVRPMLLGREADDFRGLCAQMEAIEVNGKRLHTAIRYGVSQAILDAVAKATGRLMCEVVADEYGCTVSQTPIPIFTQSGDDRYDNADKMIIKRAQVLPHALINNVQTKLGEHGEKAAGVRQMAP